MKREDSKKNGLTKKDISKTFDELFRKVIEPRLDGIESDIQKQIEPRFDMIDKKLEEYDKKFNDLLSYSEQIYNRLDR